MSDFINKSLFFSLTLVAIFVLTYYLEGLLYQPSLTFIRENKNYRPEALVALMHFFSHTGDMDT